MIIPETAFIFKHPLKSKKGRTQGDPKSLIRLPFSRNVSSFFIYPLL